MNGRRGGAASIRAAARTRVAATYRPEQAASPSSDSCVKRAQTLACQRPLRLSIAAWNPVSRGGANTGTTPRPRHSRMTRPTTSSYWWVPWKIVSLSNWA